MSSTTVGDQQESSGEIRMKKLCVSVALVVVSLGLAGTPAHAASPGPTSAAVVAVPRGAATIQTLCWIWPRHCL